MKIIHSKHFWIVTTIICILGYILSCTKKDQVIITNAPANSSVLTAIKATTAPTIDGLIDGVWSNAPKLQVTTTVPNPGNGTFEGYLETQIR